MAFDYQLVVLLIEVQTIILNIVYSDYDDGLKNQQVHFILEINLLQVGSLSDLQWFYLLQPHRQPLNHHPQHLSYGILREPLRPQDV
jgi:hypothetical protein